MDDKLLEQTDFDGNLDWGLPEEIGDVQQKLLAEIDESQQKLTNLIAHSDAKQNATYLTLQESVEQLKKDFLNATNELINDETELKMRQNENHELVKSNRVLKKQFSDFQNQALEKAQVRSEQEITELTEEKDALVAQFDQLKKETQALELETPSLEKYRQEQLEKINAQEKDANVLLDEKKRSEGEFDELVQTFIEKKAEVADLFLSARAEKAEILNQAMSEKTKILADAQAKAEELLKKTEEERNAEIQEASERLQNLRSILTSYKSQVNLYQEQVAKLLNQEL